MPTKAKESAQILKARKKIKQQLAAADKKMNPKALKKMRQLIQQQISRHSPERINLKERQITIFDENQHPAKTESKFVRKLIHDLKKPPVEIPENQWRGRISPLSENETSE